MSKQAKKQPWESYPELWKDEKAFMQYLRGAFRSIWSRYPAKHVWKKAQCHAPKRGYTGRAKTLGTCAFCNKEFPASRLEVDHIEQAGSFNNAKEAIEWFWRLLDTNDNWQLACKPCHKTKSLSERKGISFEEAALSKRITGWMKKPVEEILAFLHDNGYNGSSVSNSTKRKALITKILKETE